MEIPRLAKYDDPLPLDVVLPVVKDYLGVQHLAADSYLGLTSPAAEYRVECKCCLRAKGG